MGIIALILLCGGVGVWSTWQLRGTLAVQQDAAGLLRNHLTADMMHDAVRSDVLAILQSRDPASGISEQEAANDLAEHVKTLKERIAEDAAATGSAEIAATTSKLSAPTTAYTDEANAIAAAAARGTTIDLKMFFQRFRELEQSMAAATDVIEKHSETVSNAASSLGRFAIGLVLVALLASVSAALFVGRSVRSYLVAPLLALTDAMRGLAKGDRDTVIPSLQRQDELGALAVAMAEFGSQLKAADAAKEAQARLIVDSIGNGLNALANGDLTAIVSTDLAPPFTQLKSNFNEAVANLRDLIGAVSESATAIRTGSSEIAQASEDLARRTEGNAASLEQTAGSIATMDSRLKASVGAATRTVERADRAIATVGGGRSVADEAVHAMGRVSESAKGIDSVIEGLDKIAFQTRVLAMNAAVEAGRAGEAGRGFAVVADLVSALAMRAEEEAKRARDQLTVTQTDIGTAVEAVQKVDSALADISEDVGQVHELLATMAADNQVQSDAITQISATIGTMDKATQQNAAMVEQTSAAARNLAAEVTGLGEHADKFIVDTAAKRPAAPSTRPAASPARSARAYVSPVKSLPVVAAPAMADGDDWNSF